MTMSVNCSTDRLAWAYDQVAICMRVAAVRRHARELIHRDNWMAATTVAAAAAAPAAAATKTAAAVILAE
jgi:hypothetical protein